MQAADSDFARELPLIDPDYRLVHGVAEAEASPDGSLAITTQAPMWSYAVELPVASADDAVDTGVRIVVDLTVTKGAIGIGCLGNYEAYLCETFRSEDDGRTQATILLKSLQACKSIMLRNSSTDGASAALIHGVSITPGDEEPMPLLQVPSETFAPYKRFSGFVPGGFYIDWLGTRTRSDVELYLSTEPTIALDRWRSPPIPATDLLLDWVPLLEAVELAGERFTAVALGAGWGRWIVGCAYAAMQRGKDYYIVGVEAEPQHFAWMQRHLADNEIDPAKARLIPAAANAYTGFCVFQVGNSTNNYGQAIVSETQLESADFIRDLESAGLTPTKTACVDLVEVLRGVERVDYMHMDIQGSEADFLLAHPEELEQKVAVVNIGTHSELIERRLRRHFTEQGWLCRYDIPMNGTIMACLEGEAPAQIGFGDGVQVWENPRLTGRTQAPSFVVTSVVSADPPSSAPVQHLSPELI